MTVVFCIIGVSLNQNNMNTLTILLQADASEEGFSAILIIGGLLFICLCFLVFYRKNFAIMKSKKSANEKPWICFDEKPKYLKGLKKMSLSKVLAVIFNMEKSKN